MSHRPLRWVLLLGVLASACGSGGDDADPVADDGPGSAGVEVSEQSRESYNQCLADHGGVVAEDGIRVNFPDRSPDPETMSQILEDCRPFLPETPELTDAEIRATYDRWLVEADCLREHGFDPDPAPSFETFLADWRGNGPWDPLHGVDTSSWTGVLLDGLKEDCGLEFFHIG